MARPAARMHKADLSRGGPLSSSTHPGVWLSEHRIGAHAEPPRWEREGRDWPNRDSSRFIVAGGIRWHVQILGAGPTLLLVHGTAAATHSWRDLAPLLARHFTVIAPDLPGHGYTQALPAERMSLPAMAAAVHHLLLELDAKPAVTLGHSAGAAVLAHMCLARMITPRLLISMNGALLPLSGLAGRLFSPFARVFAASSIAPRLFAWRARERSTVERLLRGTGSTIDAIGMELYRRLIANPKHVEAALAMMAHWDLHGLERDLPRLEPPLLQIVGGNDLTVAPGYAREVARIVPTATTLVLPRLGHLAHEEQPRKIAALVLRYARRFACL